MTPQVWPLLRHRMARAHEDAWGGMRRVAAEHPDLVERVHAHVTTHPPATAREIEVALEHDEQLNNDHWGWNWSLVKAALEHLFWAGRITSAGRTPQFERRYASLERVLPNQIADAALAEEFFSPTSLIDAPAGSDGAYFDDVVELVRRSAMAHGVGTELCLRDYFRLKGAQVRPAIEHLVSAGELEPVEVEGWSVGGRPAKAWRHRDAVLPRRLDAAAILTPFDPVVWFRDRAERLFDFSYRIEIYTPAPKRRYGYYSLPVLVGDDVVGRVDLKADRATSTLLVQSAWWEPGRPRDAAERLADELRAAADWQQLETISVADWGDATGDLAAALPGVRRHERGAVQPVALAPDEPDAPDDHAS